VEQVVDEALHARRLLEDAAMRRGQVSTVGVREVDLELGPNARERASQLVRRVRDEPLLLERAPLEALEHRVHRRGEPVDLIAGSGLRNSEMQIGASDVRDLRADRLNGTKGAAHQPPDERREDDDDDRDGDRQRTSERVGALLDVLERPRGVDDERATRTDDAP
jgi:hypothetical protein